MAGAIRRSAVKRAEFEVQIEAIRREAFSAGYAAAMRAIRELAARPAPAPTASAMRSARGRRTAAALSDDRFDARLQNDPRFLGRIERARANLRAGRGTKLEEVGTD